MLSGSFCLKINGKIKTYYEKVGLNEFNSELKKFILNKKKIMKNSYITRKPFISSKNLNLIKRKIVRNKSKTNHKIIIASLNNKIMINLLNNKVDIYKKKELPNNCHYFHLENNEFYLWLNGKISFEEVLGSRRFRYIRKPNNYNVKIMQVYTNYL